MKHHNGHPYFSYADTIMPSFMFAAGFSFRLTALRRLAQIGPAAAYRRFLVRSLGLVLVSMIMYHFDFEIKHWAEMTAHGSLEVRRRADQGEPVGSAGDHRRHPDLPDAGDRRQRRVRVARPGRLRRSSTS